MYSKTNEKISACFSYSPFWPCESFLYGTEWKWKKQEKKCVFWGGLGVGEGKMMLDWRKRRERGLKIPTRARLEYLIFVPSTSDRCGSKGRGVRPNRDNNAGRKEGEEEEEGKIIADSWNSNYPMSVCRIPLIAILTRIRTRTGSPWIDLHLGFLDR